MNRWVYAYRGYEIEFQEYSDMIVQHFVALIRLITERKVMY